MNAFMKPAWRVTYLLEGYDSDDMLSSWHWEGSAKSERYVLTGREPGDPTTSIGRATVTSWQPYKKDALVDAHRAVLDLCVVIGASIGGLSVKPVLPAVSADALDGAMTTGGLGMTDSVSFALTQKLDSRDKWFVALDRLNETPALRADLDTFMVAKRERDRAARTLNLYRVYDRYARQLLDAEGLLVPEKKEREAVVAAAVGALPAGLSSEERLRAEQAVGSALARLRMRPRLDVIHEAVIRIQGCETIPRPLIERIESRRGRVAHNPTLLDEAVADQEADSTLFTLVWSLLKNQLGL